MDKDSRDSNFLHILFASSAVKELLTVCKIFKNSFIIISIDKVLAYLNDSE